MFNIWELEEEVRRKEIMSATLDGMTP